MTIVLLAILLFNWGGYQLLISYIQSKQNAALDAQIDEARYDESQLITVKVPMTALPYYNNSKSFERREGQIEITGVQYNYVKQRIYHDSLELVCIPNKAATQLRSAKDDFFKLVNDLQYGQSKKTNSHNNNYKNFSLDHFTLNDFCELQIAILTLAKNRSPYLDDSSFDFSSSDEHPPDTQA